MPAQRKPVLARHHDVKHVKHDQIDGILCECGACRCRVRHKADAQTVFAQICGKRLSDVAMVVDHQDVRLTLAHGN
jgi:hypothetical protein